MEEKTIRDALKQLDKSQDLWLKSSSNRVDCHHDMSETHFIVLIDFEGRDSPFEGDDNAMGLSWRIFISAFQR
jgi:hypothetical protein